MATKAKTLQAKDKEKDDKAADAPEKDSPDAPSPLLDLSDAAVKKMIKQAKKRGFVTFDQLNEVLPSDTTSPEQIEDIMSMLSDMGINVSESDDADSDEEETKEEAADDDTDNELVEVTQKAVTEVQKSEPGEPAPTIRPHVSARDGHGRAFVARRRNRDRKAHRGRPRGDDRGPVRKPADLPGHHHLARRVERRKNLPSRHHRSRSHLCRPRRQEQHEPGCRRRRPRRPPVANGNARRLPLRRAGRAARAPPSPTRSARRH